MQRSKAFQEIQAKYEGVLKEQQEQKRELDALLSTRSQELEDQKIQSAQTDATLRQLVLQSQRQAQCCPVVLPGGGAGESIGDVLKQSGKHLAKTAILTAEAMAVKALPEIVAACSVM